METLEQFERRNRIARRRRIAKYIRFNAGNAIFWRERIAAGDSAEFIALCERGAADCFTRAEKWAREYAKEEA